MKWQVLGTDTENSGLRRHHVHAVVSGLRSGSRTPRLGGLFSESAVPPLLPQTPVRDSGSPRVGGSRTAPSFCGAGTWVSGTHCHFTVSHQRWMLSPPLHRRLQEACAGSGSLRTQATALSAHGVSRVSAPVLFLCLVFTNAPAPGLDGLNSAFPLATVSWGGAPTGVTGPWASPPDRAMLMTACDLSAITKPWPIQQRVGGPRRCAHSLRSYHGTSLCSGGQPQECLWNLLSNFPVESEANKGTYKFSFGDSLARRSICDAH